MCSLALCCLGKQMDQPRDGLVHLKMKLLTWSSLLPSPMASTPQDCAIAQEKFVDLMEASLRLLSPYQRRYFENHCHHQGKSEIFSGQEFA